jgi:casein kinase II subunit alpha
MPSTQTTEIQSMHSLMSNYANGYNIFKNLLKGRNAEDYELLGKIGAGKYSEVFAAVHTASNKVACIKVLKPVHPQKVQREIKILRALQGGPNIITLFDTLYNPITQSPALVMEFVRTSNFSKYHPVLQDSDIRLYMYNLLSSVNYAHSKGTV